MVGGNTIPVREQNNRQTKCQLEARLFGRKLSGLEFNPPHSRFQSRQNEYVPLRIGKWLLNLVLTTSIQLCNNI